MARILLGVSGGIAAYKALEFVRLASGAGHSLRVIQTPSSKRFVGAASFAALTGAPVLTGEFERDPARGAFPDQSPPEHDPLSHLELVGNADLYLIAPASANTIAKLAHGLADNLLTSAALAAECPLAVAPAMNDRMYRHPATRANIELLRERGARILEPEEGRLASKGEHGIGRLMEPALILAECEALLAGSSSTAGARGTRGTEGRGSWEGVRVLVTAGGTREAIDSVRFLGNSSSGRMGLALAQAARARGAEVSVIAANVSLPRPEGVEWQEVVSAGELEDACKARFPECEILLMAAAVADYRPTEPLARKLKKHEHDRVHLELESTPDVLAGLAAARTPSQTLVGFAAEHGEGAVERGRGKLKMKCLDAVVVNDISRADIGFESESNEVTIVTAEGEEHLPRAPKASIAEAILDAVERLRLDRSLEGDV